MTNQEKTAYHEAGHLVIGILKLFDAPDYDFTKVVHITIERQENGANAQVKGLSYYHDTYSYQESTLFFGLTKYPKYADIKNNLIELNKLKKESAKSMGGLISEYLFCKTPSPKFDGTYDEKDGGGGDIRKYRETLKISDGFYERNEGNEQPELEKLETELCVKFWEELVQEVYSNEKVKEAIITVKELLITKLTIKGEELQNLISSIYKKIN